MSNTSGLSVNTLASFLPEANRHQFCGVHFFNPPRYMHLAELIPADKTSPVLLDNLESLAYKLSRERWYVQKTPLIS